MGALDLGASGSGTSSLTIGSNGSLTVRGGINVSTGGAGVMTVTNGGSLSTYDGSLYLGAGGSLTVSGNGSSLEIGTKTSGVPEDYDSSNPGVTPVVIGSAGWLFTYDGASVSVSDRAQAKADGVYVGGNGTALSEMTVTGQGTNLDAQLVIMVGGDGNDPDLTGNGLLTISDGATARASVIAAGIDANTTGTILVTGAGSNLSSFYNNSRFQGKIYAGLDGDGKIIVQNGGSLSSSHAVRVGWSSGSVGRLIIGGETVAAAAGSVTATNGVVFGPGDGEVIFNHTNSDYVFGSSISGNGSVTVKSGTTTLSGTNTYTRGTDLDGGILNVTGSLSGSNTGVAMSGATLTNSGSIAGNTYGVVFDTVGNTLSSNGRISGSVASVLFGRGGNTLNISQNASFSGVVDYDLSTGNTTRFAAGSYRIPAAHYLDTQNAIALNNSNQMVVLENASSPSGYINVVAVPAASQAATQYSSSVADVIGSILSLDVARPDQVNVGGTTISALQYGEEKPESTEAKAVRVLGDGVAVDGYGNLFWTRSFGGLRYQPAGDKDPASHTSHYGVISGIDHQFENHRLGFFAGGGSVSSNTADNASTMDGVTGFAGIYGAVELGGLQWNASVTAGGIDNKAGRAINNAGTIETAEGNFMGWYVSPEVAVSRAYDIASQWQLTPSLKLRYTGAFYNGYDESGSSQNLSFDERQTHSLDGKLQVELKRKLTLPSGLPASVTASAALVDTQALGSGSTHVSLNNNELTVAGSTDRNVVGASLGFGFDAMISDRAAVYGGIDGTINSDESMSAAGRLGLKLAF